jgi:hypothetical protein
MSRLHKPHFANLFREKLLCSSQCATWSAYLGNAVGSSLETAKTSLRYLRSMGTDHERIVANRLGQAKKAQPWWTHSSSHGRVYGMKRS